MNSVIHSCIQTVRPLFAAAFVLLGGASFAADHGDTPLLASIPRHDARITDFHAFTRDGNLVLALSVNPAIPPSASSYTFASDLTLRMHIDNDAEVSFSDPMDVQKHGGTLLDPAKIAEEIVFEVTFDKAGQPRLTAEGIDAATLSSVKMFTGLRDDPFIRAPRNGRNVAAIVIEVPLAAVRKNQSTLVLWSTSKVPDINGPISDLAGRSLRSQFPENDAMNTLRPRQHYTDLSLRPDVVIFDTSRPAAYPNGRALEDDVVDLVGDSRVVNSDSPFPTANDVPFLAEFPYLAPPQL